MCYDCTFNSLFWHVQILGAGDKLWREKKKKWPRTPAFPLARQLDGPVIRSRETVLRELHFSLQADADADADGLDPNFSPDKNKESRTTIALFKSCLQLPMRKLFACIIHYPDTNQIKN